MMNNEEVYPLLSLKHSRDQSIKKAKTFRKTERICFCGTNLNIMSNIALCVCWKYEQIRARHLYFAVEHLRHHWRLFVSTLTLPVRNV